MGNKLDRQVVRQTMGLLCWSQRPTAVLDPRGRIRTILGEVSWQSCVEWLKLTKEAFDEAPGEAEGGPGPGL